MVKFSSNYSVLQYLKQLKQDIYRSFAKAKTRDKIAITILFMSLIFIFIPGFQRISGALQAVFWLIVMYSFVKSGEEKG
jgi:hypothetical protein